MSQGLACIHTHPVRVSTRSAHLFIAYLKESREKKKLANLTEIIYASQLYIYIYIFSIRIYLLCIDK